MRIRTFISTGQSVQVECAHNGLHIHLTVLLMLPLWIKFNLVVYPGQGLPFIVIAVVKSYCVNLMNVQ